MAKTEPQQIGFADSAPFQVSYTQELPPIPTPVDAVFEVFKDNRGGVKWLGWFVTSVEPTSDPEHGVGSTREVTFLYGLGKLKERYIGWEDQKLWPFTATSFRPGVFSKFVERAPSNRWMTTAAACTIAPESTSRRWDGLSLASRSRGCLGRSARPCSA